MRVCRCECHGRFEHPCSIPGGCGHLHQASALDRPSNACIVCKPPRGKHSWKLSESGFFTCQQCRDGITSDLEEIGQRYYLLNPRPGSSSACDGTRGAPGFGSRSPASDHIIVMRDSRSAAEAHVWMGGDGRVHRESDHPPLSVFSILFTEAQDTFERRSLSDASLFSSVIGLTVFLGRHVEWWCRQSDVDQFAGRVGALVNQLRPVTGEPRPKPFARCPNVIDLGEGETRTCGGLLYVPDTLAAGVILCQGCGRPWNRDEWSQLSSAVRVA